MNFGPQRGGLQSQFVRGSVFSGHPAVGLAQSFLNMFLDDVFQRFYRRFRRIGGSGAGRSVAADQFSPSKRQFSCCRMNEVRKESTKRERSQQLT